MEKRKIILGAIVIIAIYFSGCKPSDCECKRVMEIKAVNGNLNWDDQNVYDECHESYSYYKERCNNK